MDANRFGNQTADRGAAGERHPKRAVSNNVHATVESPARTMPMRLRNRPISSERISRDATVVIQICVPIPVIRAPSKIRNATMQRIETVGWRFQKRRARTIPIQYTIKNGTFVICESRNESQFASDMNRPFPKRLDGGRRVKQQAVCSTKK